MENSHAMFELWWQKQQQAETQYIENIQLEKEHPDLCDEESEERSELFFQPLANDDDKKK